MHNVNDNNSGVEVPSMHNVSGVEVPSMHDVNDNNSGVEVPGMHDVNDNNSRVAVPMVCIMLMIIIVGWRYLWYA